MRGKINGCSEVLVLIIHIKAQALRVDGVPFGAAFESQLFFLGKSLRIEDANGVIARGSYPHLFSRRHIHDTVRSGVDVCAVLARECLLIDGADARIGPVADVHNSVAYGDATGSLRTFSSAELHFICGKSGDFANTVVARVHHVDRTDINSRNPDGSRAGVVSDVIHRDGSLAMI